ncbi:MAG: PepSY domain protein [Gemmatimonadetes bacterium]|nr:PepSY domain protein [Gemmatimonadota bacterium]
MFRITTLAVACALVCSLSQRSSAQATTPTQKVDPALAAEAKITFDSARAIALHKVPHGTIASEELERENGHLIYSFDVKVPGKLGIQEVNVNAITGAVLGVHHENAAAERKEARADSAAARKDSSHRASP